MDTMRQSYHGDSQSPDHLYQRTLDPNVPRDEAIDAEFQLAGQFNDAHKSDPMAKAIMEQITDIVETGELEDALLKTSLPVAINTGDTGLARKSAAYGDHVDTYSSWVRTDGRIERPLGINFATLKKIGREVPIISAVVSLRRRQMGAFASVPETDGQTGFKVIHKDIEHRLTNQEEKVAQAIQEYVLNSGFEGVTRDRIRLGRKTFPEVLSQIVEASLMIDGIAVETEPNRRGDGFVGYYIMDVLNTRLIDPRMGYNRDKEIYLVEVDGKDSVRATFTLQEAFYYTRNSSAFVDRYSYGHPEPERLLKILNGFMMALQYNTEAFNRNAIPRGILQLFGNYDKKAISQLRREFKSQMMGLHSRYGFPIIRSREKSAAAEWIRTGVDFNEMGYARWLTFLVSITCALYGVSPEEINLDSYSARSSSLSGNDTAEKIASAKDKGFKPFLRHIEQLFNQYLIGTLDDRFRLQFVGVDQRDEERLAKSKEEVMTVNEKRAELGLKPHEDEVMGDAPLDQTHMQLYIQTALGGGEEEGGVPGEDQELEEGEAPPEKGEEDIDEMATEAKEVKETTVKSFQPNTRYDGFLRI